MTESKSKGLPDEPFGQHLAAKITLKRQHALEIAQANIAPANRGKATVFTQLPFLLAFIP
ncbi:MAG: hypothetical protein ACRC47_13460 [Shewanella sp.]